MSSEDQEPGLGGTDNLRGGASWWKVGSGGPWVTQQRPRVLRGPPPPPPSGPFLSPPMPPGNMESSPGPLLPTLTPKHGHLFPCCSFQHTFMWLFRLFSEASWELPHAQSPMSLPPGLWPWSPAPPHSACLHEALLSPRLKTISLVIQHEGAEEALRAHEEQLKEAQAVPAALPELGGHQGCDEGTAASPRPHRQA